MGHGGWGNSILIVGTVSIVCIVRIVRIVSSVRRTCGVPAAAAARIGPVSRHTRCALGSRASVARSTAACPCACVGSRQHCSMPVCLLDGSLGWEEEVALEHASAVVGGNVLRACTHALTKSAVYTSYVHMQPSYIYTQRTAAVARCTARGRLTI